MLREPEEQLKLGVLPEDLDGHGWHFYGVYSETPNEGIDRFYSHLRDFVINNNVFSGEDVYRTEQRGLAMNTEFVEEKIGQPGLLSSALDIHVADGGDDVGFSVYWIPGRFVGLAHNVDGRMVYVRGTEDALDFLNGKLKKAARDPKAKEELKGKVFSMIDVLRSQARKNA